MNIILSYIKKEAVLFGAMLAAIISCFFVTTNIEYINYIDFRTILILFSLMAVMCGLQKSGIFSFLAYKLLCVTKTVRHTALVLILLCFFSSMLITNDVALITFVPFALNVLSESGKKNYIPAVAAMQTIAANLGSILTPIGNPQNLYLYSLLKINIADFVSLLFPYWILALLLISSSLLFFPKDNIENKVQNIEIKKKTFFIYFLFFLICIISVLRFLSVYITALLIILILLFYDMDTLKKIDYSLLLTFIFLFIFIGNLGNIPGMNGIIENGIEDNEIIVSITLSQFMSNVPAAILLSGFTKHYDLLLIGTNIGGLGTLIASMASLISYKYIAGFDASIKKEYFKIFTLSNLIFLIILSLTAIIIRS